MVNMLVATAFCVVLAFPNRAKCTGQIVLSTGDFPATSSAIPIESPAASSRSRSPSNNPSKAALHSSQVEFTSHDDWMDAIGGNVSLICIDFNDFSLGTDITTQYQNSSGVTFTNGRYQVSRSSLFMDGYGLFSFQDEIHINLYAESTAIGVNLYQKYLRVRLLDDNGDQSMSLPSLIIIKVSSVQYYPMSHSQKLFWIAGIVVVIK
jgi:hypothetical protein